MKNITLAVDENTLDAVRIFAAKNKTTVNALVRNELERIAMSEDRLAWARKRIRELSDSSTAEVGKITWSREDLYDR